ncbi:MAG TPA: HAD family hydrolase [Clostridiales bacterium]|nr:HAD family hydrolase [Clostridiales bacterium]
MTIEDREYDIILFDLDGTITDSKPGIVNSILYALESFNIYEEDLDKLNAFIGPPLTDSFKKLYEFDDDKAILAVEKYREYYREKGIYQNTLYDGIDRVIESLYNDSKILVLATSKPTVFAEKVLEYHNISQYFKSINGSNLDGTRAYKDEVIEYTLSNMGEMDRTRVIMIGDRKYDVIGAKQHNIDSIGVLYGYGSMHEIKSASPTYVVQTPRDLLSIISK